MQQTWELGRVGGSKVALWGRDRAGRTIVTGLLVSGLALVGAATLPESAAANTGSGTVVQTARGDGRDAPWTRLGLLGLLGIALGGGAMVQYRSSASAPPYQPKPRRRKEALPAPEVPIIAEADTPSATVRLTLPTPPPARVVDWGRPSTAPTTLDSYRRQRAEPFVRAPQRVMPTLSPAEEACARAVAAAHRYDRHETHECFVAALTLDPAVKPSVVASFWEMPAGGHADLARAYLAQGQALDARSVVTMALLTFPHNRELEALLREIAPARFVATA